LLINYQLSNIENRTNAKPAKKKTQLNQAEKLKLNRR